MIPELPKEPKLDAPGLELMIPRHYVRIIAVHLSQIQESTDLIRHIIDNFSRVSDADINTIP